MDTIFDKINAKQIPASIVFEDQHVLAFKDINPQANVHIIVIPKKKAASMADLTDWEPVEIGHFFKGVASTAKALGLDKNGYRVVLNTKYDGRQSVDYIHAHILGGECLSGEFGRA